MAVVVAVVAVVAVQAGVGCSLGAGWVQWLQAWSKGLQPGCEWLQAGLQVGSQWAAGSGVVSVR